MDWHKLLTSLRTGKEGREDKAHHDRTQFQRDFDRLIFSSPFRRLQNKTQVFPLPGSIFVHNRLTHSLEVASVGRSLGNNISRKLKEHKSDLPGLIDEIGYAVAAACLAHDMGNPPFGHSGEKALSEYFSNGAGRQYETECSAEEWCDLTSFEGNANALRLLTHQFNGRRKGGYAMTYTTIASIIKYPWASCSGIKKKYGYFQSEKETFDGIMSELEIACVDGEKNIYARHPLVYLVEAADDICYQIMDIEDAHKLRILSYDETLNLFMNFLTEEEKEGAKFNEVFKEVSDNNEQIAYLRAKVIGKLVNECTNIYLDNYDGIMAGTFNKSLISRLSDVPAQAMDIVADTAFRRVYKHPMVAEVELSGFKILGTLVDEFTKAVLNPEPHYSKMLLPFMPQQYLIENDASVYKKIQTVLDFVSGMTDVYALDIYRKLQGTGISTK